MKWRESSEEKKMFVNLPVKAVYANFSLKPFFRNKVDKGAMNNR